MRPGDRLCLFCGDGREAVAVIEEITRSTVRVQVESVQDVDRESPLRITLAIALSRGDRVDHVVQKSTELGVSDIWPLISERTGVRLEASRLERKLEHWQKIATSACEQCGRNRIPAIAPPASLDEILRRAAELPVDCPKYLLHPTASSRTMADRCEAMLLLVGPEGGFSDGEAEAALAAGFEALKLGSRILRAETAPIAAIAIAQARCGDLLEGA
jgi:16S rRNA (uracil1498-N3)-methyltransferase